MARWYALNDHGIPLGECEAPNDQLARAKLEHVFGSAGLRVQSAVSYELEQEEVRRIMRDKRRPNNDEDDDAA